MAPIPNPNDKASKVRWIKSVIQESTTIQKNGKTVIKFNNPGTIHYIEHVLETFALVLDKSIPLSDAERQI